MHNFVRLWCILLRNAAVQHPGKFARSCVGNTAAILHQHNMTGGDFLFQLDGKHIPRGQGILETAVVTMDNFFKDLLGEAGKQYVPYLITVALYIACSNLIGIIGLKPPTKDLNVTAALAIMSIVLIEYSGIHAKGGKRFVHSLAEPIALMTPMNILEIAIRPTSLCMRLFGNVLGAFVIMELIKLVVPAFVPAIFSLYFDLFDGLIQTYVFVFLTSLFMKETME